MAYIAPTDIKKRIPTEVWLQLFDKDSDGTVNESSGVDYDALTTAITASQSVVDTELEVSYEEGLTANGGVVDERIKGAQVMIALYEAVRYGPLATGDEKSVYRQGNDDAIALLRKVRKADGVKVKTAAGGESPANRVGTVQNVIDKTGSYTATYNRVADRKDSSAF
jgi:hypothetical protein